MEVTISRSIFGGVIRAVNQATYSCDLLITLETRLVDDLNLSRIGRIKLAMSLEEIFLLELSDDVLEQAVTVGDIVDYLSRHYFRDRDFSCDVTAADDVVQSAGVSSRLGDWLRRKIVAGGGLVDHRASTASDSSTPGQFGR